MADLTQKQAAVLQETLLQVGLHSNDYLFLTQTETSLWMTYETTIRQKKGAEAEKIINQIKNNPDLLDRVVSLIETIRTLGLDDASNVAMDSLEENVRLLKEQREKDRVAHQAEAERKLAQQGFNPHEAYQKHLALLKQVIAATNETNPIIASALEKSLPDIAPSLILEPYGSIEKLAQFITQSASPEQAAEILSPLIPENPDPVIENVYLQSLQHAPPPVAAAVTVLKIATPQTSTPQVQKFIEHLTLIWEARGAHLNIPPTAITSLSAIQIPPPSTPPLVLSLQNQFIKAGYSTPQAHILASQFATQFVPLINTIASYTPHDPSDSPHQHAQRVSHVRIYFSNQVIEYLTLRTVYFTNPLQYYSYQPDLSSDSPLSQDQSGWFNYFVGLGKDKITNKISSVAWQRFAASEVGKKALAPIGVKAAATAATASAEAGAATAAAEGAAVAAGTAVNPLVGLAIAAVTWVASAAWPYVKNKLKDATKLLIGFGAILVGGLVGLGVAAVTGIVSLPLGLLGGGLAGAGIKSAGGVAGALAKTGNAVTSASTALVGLVATEIATPILIIGLSIPIVIALILFIINNSAYVVAPGTAIQGGIPGPGGAYPRCWPTEGTITQGPFCPGTSHCSLYSNAIDIGNSPGTAIYVTHDGTVTSCPHSDIDNNGEEDYGNCAKIISSLGFHTLYAHLIEPPIVALGATVTAGTQVGLMGSTGNSTGPHLHYELLPKNWDLRTFVPPWAIADFKLNVNTSSVKDTCYAKDEGGGDTPQ